MQLLNMSGRSYQLLHGARSRVTVSLLQDVTATLGHTCTIAPPFAFMASVAGLASSRSGRRTEIAGRKIRQRTLLRRLRLPPLTKAREDGSEGGDCFVASFADMMVMRVNSPFIPAAEEPGMLGEMATTWKPPGGVREDMRRPTRSRRSCSLVEGPKCLEVHGGVGGGDGRAGRQRGRAGAVMR